MSHVELSVEGKTVRLETGGGGITTLTRTMTAVFDAAMMLSNHDRHAVTELFLHEVWNRMPKELVDGWTPSGEGVSGENRDRLERKLNEFMHCLRANGAEWTEPAENQQKRDEFRANRAAMRKRWLDDRVRDHVGDVPVMLVRAESK